MSKRILSNPHVPWEVEVDGKDLVVRNIKATCFGGKYDKGDNGQTESGVPNDGKKYRPQCALPIRSIEAATRNSPLAFKGPHIPWLTKVKVWIESEGEGHGVMCELTDNGPDISRFPSHALDLNPDTAGLFNHTIPAKDMANKWSHDGMSYRIIGGAQYIS
jgi:hypothetical protein